MAKDNHLAILAASSAHTLTEDLLAARSALPHTTHVEVEVDRLDQIQAVLAAHVDTILLDNFSIEDLRTAVLQINGRALTEASGGITLDRIREIAATGVDLISVGALTHSVRALDLGLDINPVAIPAIQPA
jgi:nicotinate-nucleotide pyrophosphorylase (carboxylating)